MTHIVNSNIIFFEVLFILFGIILVIPVAIYRSKMRDMMSLYLIGLLFINNICIGLYHFNVGPITLELVRMSPKIAIIFHTETTGVIFAIFASFMWLLTYSYATGYLKLTDHGTFFSAEHAELRKISDGNNRFYFCMSLAIFSVNCIAYAANLTTLFMFYELLTISTYPLIVYTGTAHSKHAGRKYLAILIFASMALFLPAVIMYNTYFGGVNFARYGVFDGFDHKIGFIIYILIFLGIAKTAIFPFHSWLPAAMVAPTPVSALLHAVAVVKAGVFSLMKITFFLFGADYVRKLSHDYAMSFSLIKLLPCFTIIYASYYALIEKNIKKILAYSTISQLSYMVLAILLLDKKSVSICLYYMLAHGFAKIALFFAAGIIYTKTHLTNIDEIKSIYVKMPVVIFGMLLASLSIIGIPPTSGFFAKYSLLRISVHDLFILITITISAACSALYLLRIIFYAYKPDYNYKPGEIVSRETQSHLAMLVPFVTAVFAIVVLVCFSDDFITLIQSN